MDKVIDQERKKDSKQISGVWIFKNQWRERKEKERGSKMSDKEYHEGSSAAWQKLTQDEKQVYHDLRNKPQGESAANISGATKDLAEGVNDNISDQNAGKENEVIENCFAAKSGLRKRKLGATDVEGAVVDDRSRPVKKGRSSAKNVNKNAEKNDVQEETVTFRGVVLNATQKKLIATAKSDLLRLMTSAFSGVKLQSGNTLTSNTTVPRLLSFLLEWKEERRRNSFYPGPNLDDLANIEEVTKALHVNLKSGLENTGIK